MFGKKQHKIEELEMEIENLKCVIAHLENDINGYEKKFNAIENTIESTPADCVRGAWCEACGFVKRYYLFRRGLIHKTIMVCGKGQSCEHFVPQEVNTNA